MFVRIKKAPPYEYLQIVENNWLDGKSVQRVIGTIGRIDRLQEKGDIDNLLKSLTKYSEHALLLMGGASTPASNVLSIGPALVFERLWEQTGIRGVITDLLKRYKFSFSVERAIFLTVLHRLFCSGSDRHAEQWVKRYRIKGVSQLQLHHLYRAMAWLGRELDNDNQFGATGFSRRCIKDLIEEALFAYRRDLFTELNLVFFDTTSLYFEGEGGQELGRYGYS